MCNEDLIVLVFCNIQGNIYYIFVEILVLLFRQFLVQQYINNVKDIYVLKGLYCMSMLYQQFFSNSFSLLEYKFLFVFFVVYLLISNSIMYVVN